MSDEGQERVLTEAQVSELLRIPIHLLAEPVPATLFHYTSAEGIVSITEKPQIYCSHIGALNDLSEASYAMRHIATELERLEEYGFGKGAEGLVETVSNPQLEFFVSCFSEEGDILPMWRSYGDSGTGYALGFRQEQLSRCGTGQLIPVTYGEAACRRKARSIVDWFTDNCEPPQTEEEFHSMRSSGLAFSLVTLLVFLAHSCKADDFSYEREWRLIATVDTDQATDGPSVNFRARNGLLLPYILHDLPTTETGALDIAEIHVGPGLHDQETVRFLSLLLRMRGVTAEVRASSVRLR